MSGNAYAVDPPDDVALACLDCGAPCGEVCCYCAACAERADAADDAREWAA